MKAVARAVAVGVAGGVAALLVLPFFVVAVVAGQLRTETESPAVAPVDAGANPLRQFGAAVMTGIGAGATPVNLDAFAAWAAGEGSCARFNPLATTEPEGGATPFNTLASGGHVWNYPTFDVGVAATTAALWGGPYQAVIDAFRASAGILAVATAVEDSPWGTRHFGPPSYAGAVCPGGSTGPVTPPGA